jgi:sortase A
VELAVREDAPPREGLRSRVAIRRPQPPAAQRVPRAPLSVLLLTITWTLAALSGLAVWFLLYAGVLSGFQEAGSQHALYGTLRSEIAQEIAPPFQNFRFGMPVAILRVPQAGIDDVVLDGTTAGILEKGPGLKRDTPLPGEPGQSVIFGRQTLFGGPFRHLSALRRGDLLDVTTGAGTFTYRVEDLHYSGGPKGPGWPAGQSRLTLVTAAGSGWRQFGVPNELLYVDASLVGNPVASPKPVPAGAVPLSERPLQGDTSVLMPLVLWLQLLLVLVLGVIRVAARWGTWQTWLVSAPALLAVLWVVSETVFQLLPNLL